MPARFDLLAFLSRHRTAKSVLASFIAVVVISLVTFTARAWWNEAVFITKREGGDVRQMPATQRVEAELITLTPSGFEPSEINRTEGRFLLAVDNRSGIREITLRLERENGGRLQEIRLPIGKLDWRHWVDLPPGRYILAEAGHSEWICSITITSR
jgi:hypothetical protein